MTRLEHAKKYEDYIIKLRRHFHENPELSGKEFNTVARILKELEEMGVEAVEIENGGVFATIKGNKEGKTVLLRGDCDALPVTETDNNLKNPRTCKSKVEGAMHACGHDGHTAMMLGAAKMLKDLKDEIEGTVHIFFERGEEGTQNYRYLFPFLDKNNIKIDTAFAIHTQADVDSGIIGINDGGMMAGVMGFDITIEGRGGHGSRPDQSINPIDAFAAIYQGMQGLRMTHIDPYKALTYSVGVVQSGAVSNVIPQTIRFAGTARIYDREVGKKFHIDFKHFVEKTCEAYNCVPTFTRYSIPSFPVLNNKECAEFARNVINNEFGETVSMPVEPWMASESFSTYTSLFPSVFAFLGIRNEEEGIGAAHHNEYFDLDESVLHKGSASAVTYAIEFLKSDLKPEFTPFEGGQRGMFEELGRQDFIKELYE